MENLFRGLFDNELTALINVTDFLLCIGVSLVIGLLMALCYMFRTRYTKSFVVTRERKGVKQAILPDTVEAVEDGYSTLKIQLETGRTHQIRVQFASRGLPLCGDRRYGAPASSGNALALCACELKFRHPKTKETLEFKI